MPSVNDANHRRLLERVQRIFTGAGWIVADAGYEKVYSAAVRLSLSKCDEIAAHLIRTRADRFAIHEPTGRIIWHDAKTSTWPAGREFCVEAVPFLKACSDADKFGIDYVFCCERIPGGETYAVQAGRDAVQRIRRVLIPAWRRSDQSATWREWCVNVLKDLGSSIVPRLSDSEGSGDVFLALDVEGVTGEPREPCQSIEQWSASIVGSLCL